MEVGMVTQAEPSRTEAHEQEKSEPGTWCCKECGNVNMWERGRGKYRIVHSHCTRCGLRRPTYAGPRKTR